MITPLIAMACEVHALDLALNDQTLIAANLDSMLTYLPVTVRVLHS